MFIYWQSTVDIYVLVIRFKWPSCQPLGCIFVYVYCFPREQKLGISMYTNEIANAGIGTPAPATFRRTNNENGNLSK